MRSRFNPFRHPLALLGLAFVAAIAYVDPGNVAANVTAGARYGYLLLWVLFASNAIAVVVQYQSAKLGLATDRTLPELIGDRMRRGPRLAFWVQAELVAAATDLAEVLGGAIALQILFGLPLLVGGAIVGMVSMILLEVQSRTGQRQFEFVIIGLLGATVMPHAIYVHSALARDRHRGVAKEMLPMMLRVTRTDVAGALTVAGAVSIAMLLLAATALQGVPGTDTIVGAHAAITNALGPAIGVIFGIPFALVPLALLSGDQKLMGSAANGRFTQLVLWAIVATVVALNVVLLVLLAFGRA